MDAIKLYEDYDYSVEDIYALPDGKRAEIVDGRWYDMAPPSPNHQRIISIIHWRLKDYIKKKGGDCESAVCTNRQCAVRGAGGNA